MRNQRGEIATATVILICGAFFLLAPIIMKNGNPFDRSADPSDRRTASAISGKDIVEITNAVAVAEQPVTVKVDRSVEASKEVTDPKLTIGQRVGRFFSGLGTWAVVLIVIALALGIITPAGLAWRARNAWKTAFKNTVEGVRDLDEETYQKVAPKLAAKQDKRDKKLVDRVKMELH